MMTLQQTLTIPKATTHLSVDFTEPVPAGTATFWLEWAAPTPKSKKELATEAIEALCGLYESDGHAVDRFLEQSHAEKLREYEIEERGR
jgi:hypothetical protein